MSKSKNSIIGVACGMPFSGTTYLSRIICSHPKIDSGFECGLLFEQSPKFFSKREKFYNWMMSDQKPYNWKLSKEEMQYICDTDDFYEAYSRIVEKCHLFKKPNIDLIIDKTPAYIYRLMNIMKKLPQTPFILIKKNIEFQYSSYKNRGRSLEEFENLYRKQHNVVNRVKNRPILNKRLLVLDFHEVQTDLEKTINTIFRFIQEYSEIEFNPKMIPSMIESINSDVKSNQKKLRKKFDYNTEIKNFKNNFTNYEKTKLQELMDLDNVSHS